MNTPRPYLLASLFCLATCESSEGSQGAAGNSESHAARVVNGGGEEPAPQNSMGGSIRNVSTRDDRLVSSSLPREGGERAPGVVWDFYSDQLSRIQSCTSRSPPSPAGRLRRHELAPRVQNWANAQEKTVLV